MTVAWSQAESKAMRSSAYMPPMRTSCLSEPRPAEGGDDSGWQYRGGGRHRPPRGGFVLLDNVGGDAAVAAERDALVFRPRPDVRVASTAGGSPPRLVSLTSARPAGVFEVGGKLAGESRGVAGVQIDLVVGAADPEPHDLSRRAAIKIVF